MEINRHQWSIDVPLMSAGLDSLAAAAFVATLSARLSVDVAPTELFDHPTLGSIASFLALEVGADSAAGPGGPTSRATPERRAPASSRESETIISALSFQLAGSVCSRGALRRLVVRAQVANTRVPATRWSTPTPGAGPSATYGSFASAA